MKDLSADQSAEIAAAPVPLFDSLHRTRRVNRHIARSEGFNESLAGAWDQGVYALFEEMEEKDAHLFSILQTRKNGLLARPRRVEPASAGAADQERAGWVERALEQIPAWDGALLHLLDSLGKGMAVVEIIWGYDESGRIVPAEIKPRSAWRFRLGPGGEIYLHDNIFAEGLASDPAGLRPGETKLPGRKFVVLTFGATDERPHGRGLCERVYWYWWFKKNNLKFWVMYNEKFGSPTVVAKHPPGVSEAERERLLEVISSLQADAGVTVPEGVELELLEPTRRGSAETYRDLANWCNEEMSRGVLGQTLTSGEGERSGSLALAKVHEAVRLDYIRTDACSLMNVINSRLIRWMIDFNFGETVPAPRWIIDLTPEPDKLSEVEVDSRLLQMGVPIPVSYFFDKYQRPSPMPGERSLRYDDNNLFQYHLQFGVLTVNEVRASLGLPPVEWGDRPTSAVLPPEEKTDSPVGTGRMRTVGPPAPKAPTGGSGDDRPETESEGEEEAPEEL